MLSNSPLSGRTQIIYPSPAEGHLGCFQVWVIMNKAAIDVHVQVTCGHKFLSLMANTKKYGTSVFCFARSCQTVSHSGCTSSTPTAATRVLWLHVLSACGVVSIGAVTILTGVWWCLGVLICSSLRRSTPLTPAWVYTTDPIHMAS